MKEALAKQPAILFLSSNSSKLQETAVYDIFMQSNDSITQFKLIIWPFVSTQTI